jgi:hypothetical protein
MTNHKMVAILEQFQLTEKTLQRFTNKVHLPAEGVAATAVVIHAIFHIPY